MDKNMLNKETAHEFMSARKAGSLGESVDILRECVEDLSSDVQELYDLDDDNFQQIKNLQKNLDLTNNRINHLAEQVRKNRGKTVMGFIGLAGMIWLGKKILDHFDKRISDLENADSDGEKAEESDG